MSLLIIFIGAVIFVIIKRYKLFSIKLPKWLSIEYLFFLPSYLLMKNLCYILYGDKCPINEKDLGKLADKDTEKIGFIDRFIITANVLNKRYEKSIIKSDALIYAVSITAVLIYLLFSNINI